MYRVDNANAPGTTSFFFFSVKNKLGLSQVGNLTTSMLKVAKHPHCVRLEGVVYFLVHAHS